MCNFKIFSKMSDIKAFEGLHKIIKNILTIISRILVIFPSFRDIFNGIITLDSIEHFSHYSYFKQSEYWSRSIVCTHRLSYALGFSLYDSLSLLSLVNNNKSVLMLSACAIGVESVRQNCDKKHSSTRINRFTS